jgi:hypothetical protein
LISATTIFPQQYISVILLSDCYVSHFIPLACLVSMNKTILSTVLEISHYRALIIEHHCLEDSSKGGFARLVMKEMNTPSTAAGNPVEVHEETTTTTTTTLDTGAVITTTTTTTSVSEKVPGSDEAVEGTTDATGDEATRGHADARKEVDRSSYSSSQLSTPASTIRDRLRRAAHATIVPKIMVKPDETRLKSVNTGETTLEVGALAIGTPTLWLWRNHGKKNRVSSRKTCHQKDELIHHVYAYTAGHCL